MCTGRVDLSFIFRALASGADGVFIGGCWPGECHYITEGNYDALANMHITKKLLQRIGLSPERLRLEWIAASEGMRFAEVMNEMGKTLTGLGPLGAELGEGVDPHLLQSKLEAVRRLVPYIRLVEREKLRPPVKSEQVYNEFYGSAEVNRLFDELITDRLVASQIMLLLEKQPLGTAQIAEALGLSPSAVSRHMSSSSRQGMVRYDVASRRFAPALGVPGRTQAARG